MKKVTGLSLLLCIGGVRSNQYFGNCGKGKVVFLEYPTSGLSAAKKTYMAGLDLTGCVSRLCVVSRLELQGSVQQRGAQQWWVHPRARSVHMRGWTVA